MSTSYIASYIWLCAFYLIVGIVLAEKPMYRFIAYQELSLAKDSRRNSSANNAEKVILQLFMGKIDRKYYKQ